MTKLIKSVTRETAHKRQSRAVVVTLAPAGSQSDALIAFRLKGKRTQYVCAISSLFTVAAMWHGNKEKQARRQARKDGVSWRVAKKQFVAANTV